MKTCGSVLLVLACVFAAGEPEAACNVAATGVNFGTYDVFSAVPLDTAGTISVSCDEAPPPIVTIAIGTSGVSGRFNPRQMKHGARPDVLDYNLFTSAGRSVVWGDGTGGTSTVVVRRVKKNQPPAAVTVYGRVPAGQQVFAGPYGDTLTVTITW